MFDKQLLFHDLVLIIFHLSTILNMLLFLFIFYLILVKFYNSYVLKQYNYCLQYSLSLPCLFLEVIAVIFLNLIFNCNVGII